MCVTIGLGGYYRAFPTYRHPGLRQQLLDPAPLVAGSDNGQSGPPRFLPAMVTSPDGPDLPGEADLSPGGNTTDGTVVKR